MHTFLFQHSYCSSGLKTNLCYSADRPRKKHLFLGGKLSVSVLQKNGLMWNDYISTICKCILLWLSSPLFVEFSVKACLNCRIADYEVNVWFKITAKLHAIMLLIVSHVWTQKVYIFFYFFNYMIKENEITK